MVKKLLVLQLLDNRPFSWKILIEKLYAVQTRQVKFQFYRKYWNKYRRTCYSKTNKI